MDKPEDNKPEEKKATRGPSYDRDFLIAKVAMMRIKGKSTLSVMTFLQEKIGMGRATAYLVLGDAQTYILNMAQQDLDKAYEEAVQQLEELYDEASGKQKLEVRKEINKLRGLYKPQRVDVTTNVKDITSVDINIIYPQIKKDDEETN